MWDSVRKLKHEGNKTERRCSFRMENVRHGPTEDDTTHFRSLASIEHASFWDCIVLAPIQYSTVQWNDEQCLNSCSEAGTRNHTTCANAYLFRNNKLYDAFNCTNIFGITLWAALWMRSYKIMHSMEFAAGFGFLYLRNTRLWALNTLEFMVIKLSTQSLSLPDYRILYRVNWRGIWLNCADRFRRNVFHSQVIIDWGNRGN